MAALMLATEVVWGTRGVARGRQGCALARPPGALADYRAFLAYAEVLRLAMDRGAGSQELALVTPVHADALDGAVCTVLGHQGEGPAEELGELELRHFARGHREFGVAAASLAADMAIDRHVVRHIGKAHLGLSCAQQAHIGFAPERVIADHPMTTPLPKASQPTGSAAEHETEGHLIWPTLRTLRHGHSDVIPDPYAAC